ncbi:MAG: DUF2225 domain-containing protein [Roseburia sp.]
MNLFSGLEKFGIKADDTANLFEEEKKDTGAVVKTDTGEEIPAESSFLLEKAVRCTVCDKVFKTKMVKNGRVKRLEPDFDLRPRFQYIDTTKYDVLSCPFCGYTAITRYFEHLTSAQIKMVKEQVCANFNGVMGADLPVLPEEYSYDEAIERYKLALFCSMAKKAKTSEKAYTCLKIAWLLRGKAESLTGTDEETLKQKQECKEQEDAFYQQAYEGLMKAVSTEMFPICGMDQTTVDYLLAAMSFNLKKYDVASKLIAGILTSSAAGQKMKDRAYDMKEQIIAEIKKSKQ